MMGRFPGDFCLKFFVIYYLNYFPYQIWTLKMCNQDISISIVARIFKLVQLIEDDRKVTC